ncbi:MAG: MOSC domain-containing protein [Cytophagaceae bacterium]|nr:MOSC domain-containing protein [Cytophagaceae bacterium]
MLRLTELWIYPIKSLAGISLPAADLTDRGLRYDRRWMLVDAAGGFLTQREYPEMALLQVTLTADGLQISHRTKSVEPLIVSFTPRDGQPLATAVFGSPVDVQYVDDQADRWFSQVLNTPVRLVYQPEDSHRGVDPAYAHRGEINSLADGYPFLLVGQSSLDGLNGYLKQPVPMNRFRPNFVFAGATAFDEDEWNTFRVGNVPFRAVKPCARCPIPGIDQATGQRSPEVLRVLNDHRKQGHKVFFGQNLLADSTTGHLHVGDEIEVISRRETA